MKFDTSYEFLMYASLLAKRPNCVNLKIKTQKWVECDDCNFRLDIAILDDKEQVKLGIECDGMSVHHANDKQAAHDNNRQNALERMGIPIRRYTNKQIEENSLEFAEDIWHELYNC